MMEGSGSDPEGPKTYRSCGSGYTIPGTDRKYKRIVINKFLFAVKDAKYRKNLI
jgi:hypothetical protein